MGRGQPSKRTTLPLQPKETTYYFKPVGSLSLGLAAQNAPLLLPSQFDAATSAAFAKAVPNCLDKLTTRPSLPQGAPGRYLVCCISVLAGAARRPTYYLPTLESVLAYAANAWRQPYGIREVFDLLTGALVNVTAEAKVVGNLTTSYSGSLASQLSQLKDAANVDYVLNEQFIKSDKPRTSVCIWDEVHRRGNLPEQLHRQLYDVDSLSDVDLVDHVARRFIDAEAYVGSFTLVAGDYTLENIYQNRFSVDDGIRVVSCAVL